MKLHLLALPLTCSALPSSLLTSSRLTETNSPARWVHYDLTQPFNSSLYVEGALEKRRQIGVCEFIQTTAACVVIGRGVKDALVAAYNYIGNEIYDVIHSDFACDPIKGAYKEIAFQYQGYGGDCSTTAQKSTIKGAIENHLQTVDNGKVCGMECLKLDHGGSWNGYLLLGPVKTFDASVYCGPDLDYSDCSSGGKKDFG